MKGKLFGWIVVSASLILSVYSLSGFVSILTNIRVVVG